MNITTTNDQVDDVRLVQIDHLLQQLETVRTSVCALTARLGRNADTYCRPPDATLLAAARSAINSFIAAAREYPVTGVAAESTLPQVSALPDSSVWTKFTSTLPEVHILHQESSYTITLPSSLSFSVAATSTGYFAVCKNAPSNICHFIDAALSQHSSLETILVLHCTISHLLQPAIASYATFYSDPCTKCFRLLDSARVLPCLRSPPRHPSCSD